MRDSNLVGAGAGIGMGGRLAALWLLLVLGSGCSVLEPKPDTARYFMLRSMEETAPSTQPLGDLVLGLGPVSVPDYLHRVEMLEAVGPNEVRYSAENRWVEPLGTQVQRALTENLRTLLGPDAILLHPWFQTDGVGLGVEVSFEAIRVSASGFWTGSAAWVVRNPETRTALERGDFSLEVAQDSLSPLAVAVGLSEELERLSGEIAGAVRRTYAQRARRQ